MVLRMRTHNVFGFAVSLLPIRMWLREDLPTAVFTSILFTASINWFIDFVAGHRGGRRTPYTHSLITSTFIAAVIAILYIYALHILGVAAPLQQVFAASISVAVSHMMLDAMSRDGIYPLWPFTKKRLSILHIRYDNSVANTLFIVISVVIIVLVFLSM